MVVLRSKFASGGSYLFVSDWYKLSCRCNEINVQTRCYWRHNFLLVYHIFKLVIVQAVV